MGVARVGDEVEGWCSVVGAARVDGWVMECREVVRVRNGVRGVVECRGGSLGR